MEKLVLELVASKDINKVYLIKQGLFGMSFYLRCRHNQDRISVIMILEDKLFGSQPCSQNDKGASSLDPPPPWAGGGILDPL